MTKQTKQIKSKEPPHEQEQQFSEVMALTEIENLDKLLASPRSVALIHALAEFSEIDYQSEQQGPKAGEFFDRVLQMPLDVQKKLVWAIADRRGLPRPNYEHEGPGRPTLVPESRCLGVTGRWSIPVP